MQKLFSASATECANAECANEKDAGDDVIMESQ
jgi:hypothetical protein